MLKGKDISYSRGFSPLFSGLSFALEKGDLLTVKGANGSGKSTFLRLLAGLICPASSTLFWEGEGITSRTLVSYQQNLLYIGHKLALHSEARVKDQKSLWKALYGLSEKVIEEAFDTWGLSRLEDQKIDHLSQGQQKRLSLSRCSWVPRSLWILDEPDASLDQEGKSILARVLSHSLERGGCAILATHHDVSASQEILL